MREMYYRSSVGEVIRFDREGFRIQEYDLRNFRWEYTVTNRPSGIGGRVTRFSRPVQQRSLTIIARGKTPAECKGFLNRMHAVTEVDISTITPGRFYLDGQYTPCFLGYDSSLDEWTGGYHYAKKSVGALLTNPYWFTEETKTFHKGVTEVSAYGKRYDGRYPYQYGTSYANEAIWNDHYMATPVVITLYGPCVDPYVFIDNVQYGVASSAAEGERIIIDQLERRIYKVTATGMEVNLFDYRYKESDQFAPIASGESSVTFNGEFSFDITLMKQRSEPKWI